MLEGHDENHQESILCGLKYIYFTFMLSLRYHIILLIIKANHGCFIIFVNDNFRMLKVHHILFSFVKEFCNHDISMVTLKHVSRLSI